MAYRDNTIQVEIRVGTLEALRNFLQQRPTDWSMVLADQITALLKVLRFECVSCKELYYRNAFAEDTLFGDTLCFDCAIQELVTQQEDLEANRPTGIHSLDRSAEAEPLPVLGGR